MLIQLITNLNLSSLFSAVALSQQQETSRSTSLCHPPPIIYVCFQPTVAMCCLQLLITPTCSLVQFTELGRKPHTSPFSLSCTVRSPSNSLLQRPLKHITSLCWSNLHPHRAAGTSPMASFNRSPLATPHECSKDHRRPQPTTYSFLLHLQIKADRRS